MQTQKQTFFGQLFSGFFLVFWAMIIALLVCAVQTYRGKIDTMGGWGWQVILAIVITLVIFLVNYSQKEQRAKRNGTSL